MKIINRIYILPFLLLFACQATTDSKEIDQENKAENTSTQSKDKVTLKEIETGIRNYINPLYT